MIASNMKLFKTGKFCLMVFLILLLTTQIVKSLSITEPIPVGLRLMRGDIQKFYFKIYALSSTDDQSCSYSISGLDPIIVDFEENEVTVDAGGSKNIYGNFSVPDDATIQTYNGKLSVSCAPQVDVKGLSGSVIKQTIRVDFSIDVVGEAEERIAREVPEEKLPGPPYFTIIIVIILIVLILVIGVYYWNRRKKEK